MQRSSCHFRRLGRAAAATAYYVQSLSQNPYLMLPVNGCPSFRRLPSSFPESHILTAVISGNHSISRIIATTFRHPQVRINHKKAFRCNRQADERVVLHLQHGASFLSQDCANVEQLRILDRFLQAASADSAKQRQSPRGVPRQTDGPHLATFADDQPLLLNCVEITGHIGPGLEPAVGCNLALRGCAPLVPKSPTNELVYSVSVAEACLSVFRGAGLYKKDASLS